MSRVDNCSLLAVTGCELPPLIEEVASSAQNNGAFAIFFHQNHTHTPPRMRSHGHEKLLHTPAESVIARMLGVTSAARTAAPSLCSALGPALPRSPETRIKRPSTTWGRRLRVRATSFARLKNFLPSRLRGPCSERRQAHRLFAPLPFGISP